MYADASEGRRAGASNTPPAAAPGGSPRLAWDRDENMDEMLLVSSELDPIHPER